MREISIDLDKALLSNRPVGYEIAKKITASEIEYYKKILNLPLSDLSKLIKEKREERKELFEAVVRTYPALARRKDGRSEYLKKNITSCLSNWRKLTEGDIKKEYKVLEVLNEYIIKTDPAYLKKLSNWLKEVNLDQDDKVKSFSQSDIPIS